MTYKKILADAVAIGFLVAFFTADAYAQFMTMPKPVMCGPTSAVVDALKNEYQEELLEIIGISPNGEIAIMLYVNEKNKTFSIIETHVGGTTCLIAGGSLAVQATKT